MRDALNSEADKRRLSRRKAVRAGIGALTAFAGLGAARKAAIAQSSAGDADAMFCPAFGPKRARSPQPEVDFENDDYEVYLAPWSDYEIWPVSSPPSDPGWQPVGFRGTWAECEAYIDSLPAPKPMFEF